MCQQYWPRMTFFESNSSVIPLSKHTQNKNAARRSTQVSLMFASALLSWLQMLLAFEAEVPMTDLIYWGLSRIMLWFFLIIWKSVKTRHDEVNPKQISFKQLQILRKIPSTLIVRTSMVLVSTIVHLFCLGVLGFGGPLYLWVGSSKFCYLDDTETVDGEDVWCPHCLERPGKVSNEPWRNFEPVVGNNGEIYAARLSLKSYFFWMLDTRDIHFYHTFA